MESVKVFYQSKFRKFRLKIALMIIGETEVIRDNETLKHISNFETNTHWRESKLRLENEEDIYTLTSIDCHNENTHLIIYNQLPRILLFCLKITQLFYLLVLLLVIAKWFVKGTSYYVSKPLKEMMSDVSSPLLTSDPFRSQQSSRTLTWECTSSSNQKSTRNSRRRK